jgi:hypothetical protein
MDNKFKTGLTLAIIMFVAVFVYAVDDIIEEIKLKEKDFSVSIRNEAKQQYDKMHITNIKHSEVLCDDNSCKFSMYNESNGTKYKLGTHEIPKGYCANYTEQNSSSYLVDEIETYECTNYITYTDEQLSDMVEEKTKKVLEHYANVFKHREERKAEEKGGKFGKGDVAVSISSSS